MNENESRSGWLARAWYSWRVRHQHPVNFLLHGIGIPLTLVALPCLLMGWWWTAGLLLLGGYVLQFLGHALEGNDPGEVILVKRTLGLRYIAVAPVPHRSRSLSVEQQKQQTS